MKKGYVNNSMPETYKLYVPRRIVYEKNIELHDHQRNLKCLVSKIVDIGKKFDKKVKLILKPNRSKIHSRGSLFLNT